MRVARRAATASKQPTATHDEPIAPNRLADAPEATAPNQIWVAYITYIETEEGWLYLAGILDLYSRKIVGWAMSDRIDTALVLKALAMALLHRGCPTKVLFHSDRGVQYASVVTIPFKARSSARFFSGVPYPHLLDELATGSVFSHRISQTVSTVPPNARPLARYELKRSFPFECE